MSELGANKVSDKGDAGTPCHFAVGEHRVGLLLLLQSSRWGVWRICFRGTRRQGDGRRKDEPRGAVGMHGGYGQRALLAQG